MTMLRLSVVLHNGLERHVTVMKLNKSVRDLSTSGCPMSSDEAKAKPFHAIPGPGGLYQWPFIGSLLNFKPFTKYSPETIPDYFNHLHDKYGPVIRLRLGYPVVVVADPIDIETVFRNEGKYPRRLAFDLLEAYNKRNNLQATLGQLQGPEWHTLRAPVNKRLLKVDSATHYLGQQNQVVEDFVKILETQELSPEQFQDLFFRYASESIAVVLFNKRLGLFDANPDKGSVDFLKAAETALKMIQNSLYGKSVLHKWFRNETYRTFETAHNLIRRVALGHIRQAREVLDTQVKSGLLKEEEPNLLLSLLSERSLTNEQVADIMIALYFAGTDSTAKYSQVFLYNLAKNPDKQNILRREILDVLGPDGPLTSSALSRMVYLKAALKESFRLIFPLPIGNHRVLPVDVVLGGYKIPAGVCVYMFNHRATKTHFENPDQFLPERWLRSEDNTKKDPAHSMIVLPFGHGPRNCIGRRFAVQEIYLAAVKVLQKLQVDVEPESSSAKFVYFPFPQAEKPIRFKFTKIC
ncbi:probable cytochrome P450 12a5, mitochondrial [Biomphalaria glabrata]|nr:probable cytochrome P450 12a5, mitochondrial [Biomphalaria glabrata]XP_055879845.1 probable cytochrome P450 12a5, mitochondrial [Biomphalaria glabrata]XP_055879846.1 probable cytochrome P450 12a5, mitochondrial [Biomphalaria glabrata]XP_055879847.1 probable cytochrome P450 12a5, mitochondrial [Biomphalaria glabrata]XP_055879848.1 probable cytochrome P450 12a5, mitochondrial [Biomphalaria glabrata]